MSAAVDFFQSRWAPAPEHVRDLGASAALPGGFRAAGVGCGIKAGGELDLGLLVCDSEAAVSAARFCRSGVLAAPVIVSQERCRLDGLRAVVANSGNANAATGRAGLDEAARVQGAAGIAAGVDPATVALASTGVIGVLLPGRSVVAGLRDAAEQLRPGGAGDFAAAIRTTDALDKHAALEVSLPSGTVRLSAQCKGAGMISPSFATMLCFVQTDAALSAETADLLLGVCVKRSFDRISVDGQLSTNDTVILIASGESGVRVEPQTDDELRFGEALDALLRQLALLIVADGEGARRIGRVVVSGGVAEHVERTARTIADSPLVKTALYGGDPNWGRVAQAIGKAMAGMAPLPFDISIEGIDVCSGGAAVPFDAAALEQAVARDEVEYVVGLPGEGAETEVFFSDLGYEYVRINAEYTT
jgi:glutamate N-acetyltransferase / amino-acid N-acetyltransferase